LPHDLGTAGVYLRLNSKDGLKETAMIDVQQNPIPFIRSFGRIGIDVGINGKPFMKLQAMDKTLTTSVQRKNGNGVQGIIPQKGDIVAVPLDTFTVKPGIERVFIAISSQSNAPVSTLITPTGERITATKNDSSIILFKTGDNTLHFWTLVRPAMGSWQLQLANPKSTDSVLIEGLRELNTKPFALNAAANGSAITITWDGSGYAPNDRVDLFINPSSKGTGGKLIAQVDASKGTYTYSLADTLPACSYHFYGIRVAEGMMNDVVYAQGAFANPKPSVPAPSAIGITSNQYGQAFVVWTPVNDNSIIRYLVYVKDTNGDDSLITSVQASKTSVYIECDTALLRSISIASYRDDGKIGCGATAQSVLLSVDEQRGGELHADDMVLMPNPAISSVQVQYQASVEGDAVLQ
ncbi:MAG: hypothetical protein JNL32_16460, partial [Candidatus Kapabacteria bacterium]|nr:hypothetical protein [Candidatus Kapabacteria bacterium]